MKSPMPTTTLKVYKPEDYTSLEAAYQLIRYELPEDLRWQVKRASYLYGQMHNILRDQLDCPYKSYMYDMIDGMPKWVVYALYPHNASAIWLDMPISSTEPIEPQRITFEQLPLHILLKLLQIAYVRGQATRFVGQDHCYVHAKQAGPFSHICLRIDLTGDIRTQSTDQEQEFKLHGHACLFQKVGYPEGSSTPYTYFGRKITQKRVHFLHLKRREIDAAKQREEPLYGLRTRDGKKTTLAYHNLKNIEASTGKLLTDFIQEFTPFLAKFGITAQTKMRPFRQFIPLKQQMEIPPPLWKTVAVYDHRMNRSHPLQDYLQVLTECMPHMHFTELVDLSLWDGSAVLVLQDYNKKDFGSGMPLEGQQDPYGLLYKATPHIPKQSLNVNVPEDEDEDDEEDDETVVEEAEDMQTEDSMNSLSYPLPTSDNITFKRHLTVALTQLYLKEVICLKRSVQQWLPPMPTQLLFLRKSRYVVGHAPYETACYIEHDTLCFLDLRDPVQREQWYERCHQLDVDWEKMEDQLLRKHRKRSDAEKDEELNRYDIIIGPGLCIELEDIQERVLYDYTEIAKRQEAMKKQRAVEDFKLLPFYDLIRPKSSLSLKNLQDRLLQQQNAQPHNTSEAQSLTLYRQLEAFDAFLDEIQETNPTISFKCLFEDDFMEHIARIFALQANKKGKYSRRQIKGYYKKRKMLLSDKAKDVHVYEGIWYDDEHCYMVGSSQPLNQQQPRAHLIRHFDVYQGTFDIQPFLQSLSVQFVRHHQYTVYPYPFHLINLYVENMLRYI